MNTESQSVLESSRNLPVKDSFDVVVAGGGIAGVAAAVAAARNGASVCLLEKACGLGGLATLGNVTIWLPICDGMGRQVMGGLPEELLKLSVADLQRDNASAQFFGIPACWKPGGDPEGRKRKRYTAAFNPASYLLALEKLIVSEGVKLLYDTRACSVVREERAVSHLVIENKSGRSAIACRCAIDATGDADICHMAGEETESLDTNVPAGWFYYLMDNALVLDPFSNPYSASGSKKGAKGPFFRGDDAEQVTAQILETRELIRGKLSEISARRPGSDVQAISVPAMACLRMTRRLVGRFSLCEEHAHQWFEDTVGLTGDWRKPGPVYAVPLRSLQGVANVNLLAAGRCISADRSAWDVTRAIPPCALTGAAAGVAAAFALKYHGGNVSLVAPHQLKNQLEKQGFLLDPGLAKPVIR